MPANVGEMFYYGEIPWHKQGLELASPATMRDALKAGGLNWEVGEMALMTCDDPPSPVPMRKAIVRLDRPAGDAGRVLGVVHQGFHPVQNRDGALLFDAIFGQGKAVYHTGGYLGDGEVVWLLAKIDKTLHIAKDDVVEPYALFANSHNGTRALTISLTTVRVVCQNTLEMALRRGDLGEKFRRAHDASHLEHAAAAQEFWGAVMTRLDGIAKDFVRLTEVRCQDEVFDDILRSLLPIPRKPRNIERNPGLKKAHEKRVADVQKARDDIGRLRTEGKGMDLEGSKGTFWGVLNAITEYVDHHRKVKGDRWSYAILGSGMDLKVRTYRLIQERAKGAA